MPLVTTDQLLEPAWRSGRGVGAFNVIHVEHAEAFVAAAERAGTGVVLQISQNAVRWHGALEPIGAATLSIARSSRVPTVVHLDHAEDRSLVSEALELGFTSIMFDGSTLDYEDNVAATAEVVAEARSAGAVVEAELGEVGGKDGVHAPGVRTDPSEAVEFVRATGVDALAVAVGTSHAMTERVASLDFGRIRELRRVVPVPLVLHGSSGVADEDLTRAVESGMTKVNVSTHLNAALTGALRAFLDSHPTVVDPRKYVGAGRDAVQTEVHRLLGVLRA
ncbi:MULTISPECIES: class II fructose-bisphosphate aldolase [unclassified Isoptericola]|uniref:class II fructose-bisphosphate aldolase n=1 Tax=unclassified Isoptericola TaxID=2623355 RepID=UPI002713295A|nr:MULTISPECIES: class II fructose-bisphosphate aldolase [unclassified Isoptericola]MDO8145631.1 class II fructose-bisphosphate aldolase [Isoptericola sp. 178]MDO8149173.1 class II fructose-bisphosphate aldolase [Isoptericola sp. b515]